MTGIEIPIWAIAVLIAFLLWQGGISTMVEVLRRRVGKTEKKQEDLVEIMIRVDERVKYLYEEKKNGGKDKAVDRAS